jgi:microcystin degradation protein MlrC
LHPYTDADDLGWAAHVCTDGDRALAGKLVEARGSRVGRARVPLPPMLSVDEGLDRAAASLWRKLGPVTIVDVGDIVGAGAPGETRTS